jgi:hypothetical protein
MATITQDNTTTDQTLSLVRKAIWDALNNWQEWAGSANPWQRKFQTDADIDELSLHDPGEFDLPALAVTWDTIQPKFLVHVAQDWACTINIVSWWPAHMIEKAEYAAWQTVRAIYQSAATGQSGKPISYVRAATGRIPEKDSPITPEVVPLGRSGQLKALRMTCSFTLTGIVQQLG